MKADPDLGTRVNARLGANLFDELIVDNFAGAGGASMGIEAACGRSVDIAINHDRHSVMMHELNHPHTRHLCEDVWHVDPMETTAGRPVGLAWFSPDCRHFSRAKGGKPVKKNIRGLAWVVIRWAKIKKPRIIVLENVREFQDWGPLTADDRPCPRRKGQTYRRWRTMLENLGYHVETRILNAADFGAPTHRRRFFLIARCDGHPIHWPEPTHGPGRRPYRTAAQCIDWSLPCPSIFLTKAESKPLKIIRPLAEKTMRRVAMGLKRYVLENPKPFIVTCNHAGPEFRGQSIDEPFKTLTAARDAHGVVQPYFIHDDSTPTNQIGEDWISGELLEEFDDWYSQTVAVGGTWGEFQKLVYPRAGEPGEHLPPSKYSCKKCSFSHVYGERCSYDAESGSVIAPYLAGVGGRAGQSLATSGNAPIGTITAKNDRAFVAPLLIEVQNGSNESGHRSIERPAHTITANPKGGGMALAAPLLTKFRGDSAGASLEQPLPTITSGAGSIRPAGAAHAMGIVTPFLASNYGEAPHQETRGQEVDEPIRTITPANNTGMLVAPTLTKYHGQKGNETCAKSPSDPLPTADTSNRFGLVSAFLAKHYGGVVGHGPERPLGTITSVDHHSVVASNLVHFNHGDKQWNAVDEPLRTITTGNHVAEVRAFLTKYYGHGDGQSADEPLHTVTSKDRMGVVTVEGHEFQIIDIGLRMLTPRELLRAQFGKYAKNYILVGTKSQQVARIGNSVPPEMAEAIVRANFSQKAEVAA
ncbi:MAG TPA: DNA cytosine methyltransferase [Tepidisphaeraceae bacterium]|nr:DNA cytosine methyltransferase [Tepidisphaeraceae bacterium]